MDVGGITVVKDPVSGVGSLITENGVETADNCPVFPSFQVPRFLMTHVL